MTIHLACATNAAYVPHVATMLKSLLLNSRRDRVHAYILIEQEVTPEQRSLLGAMANHHGAQVEYLEATSQLPAGLPTAEGYPRVVWLRILLPELLPEVERILYLDGDIVVVDDVMPLVTTSLSGNLVGAVTNAYRYGQEFYAALDLPAAESYFNTGVLLMNLAAMRAEGTAQRIADAARKYKSRFPDQAALNPVLHRRRLRLPARFNVQGEFYYRSPKDLVLDAQEVREAMQHPIVMHYTGPAIAKPWHRLCPHPRRELYALYRRQTPWPKLIPEGRSFKERLMYTNPGLAGALSRWRRRYLPRDGARDK